MSAARHVGEPGLAVVEIAACDDQTPSPSRNCSPDGGRLHRPTARHEIRGSPASVCAATWTRTASACGHSALELDEPTVAQRPGGEVTARRNWVQCPKVR